MLLDTHACYGGGVSDVDWDVLPEDLKEHGIREVINAGVSVEPSYTGFRLAERYHWVYTAPGAHPNYTEELSDRVLSDFAEPTKYPKAVTIGEIGLEHYYGGSTRDIQKIQSRRQLDLVVETGSPVIIHSREAAQDALDEMQYATAHSTGGAIHCFSSDAELVRHYTELGFYIGIGGVVTFENGRRIREAATAVPLSCILFETDSPYPASEPNRGKWSDSRNLTRIAEEIVRLWGISAGGVQYVIGESVRHCLPKLTNRKVG